MRDRVPRVETTDDGRLSWVVGGGGSLIASPGLTATAGVGNMRNPPKTFEEMHPGAYDAQERLKYMDKMGIWAMVMYPNVGGFGAQQFLKLGDPELMLTCVQMYNDWQTDWAAADARRLLPITSTPFWDVNAAVQEAEAIPVQDPARPFESMFAHMTPQLAEQQRALRDALGETDP